MGNRFWIIGVICLLCGSAWGQVIDIMPRNFTAIELKGNVKCVVSTSDSSASTITLHGITQKDVEWKVKKNTLYVNVPSGLLDKKGYAMVRINAPTLAKIAIGGAELESDGIITGSALTIETLGSINRVLMDVDVTNLNVLCTGDSDIAIKGSAQNSSLSASLGSRIDCLGCSADSVIADCQGTSEIYVRADKYLSAKALLGGSIYFSGDAALAPKTTLWGGITKVEYSDAMSSFKIFATDTTKVEVAQVIEPTKAPEPVKATPIEITKVKATAPTPATKPQPAKKPKKSPKSEPPVQKVEQTVTDEDFF